VGNLGVACALAILVCSSLDFLLFLLCSVSSYSGWGWGKKRRERRLWSVVNR